MALRFSKWKLSLCVSNYFKSGYLSTRQITPSHILWLLVKFHNLGYAIGQTRTH